jgi:hypothetical protein
MPAHEKKIISAEDKKYLILKVGVIVISLLIMILWLINLTFSFGSKNIIGTDKQSDSWRQDLQKTIDSAREGLDNKTIPTKEEKNFLDGMLTNIENKDRQAIASSSENAVAPKETESQKFLKDLKDRLPATEIASSSCPAYIDCMPTIGQARPCVIPTGCEAITQIAY